MQLIKNWVSSCPLCAFLWLCPAAPFVLKIFMIYFVLTQVISDPSQRWRGRVSEESEVSSCQTDSQVNTGKWQMALRSRGFTGTCVDRYEAVSISCRVWLWQTWKRLRRPTTCLLKTDRWRKEALWMTGPVSGKAWRMTDESMPAWRIPGNRQKLAQNGAKWMRLVKKKKKSLQILIQKINSHFLVQRGFICDFKYCLWVFKIWIIIFCMYSRGTLNPG